VSGQAWVHRRTRLAALLVLSVLGAACSSAQAAPPAAPPCNQIVPECHAKRLPNRILHGNEQKGALHSVDGFNQQGLISFDEALGRAWDEAGHSAQTVQVVLGSANADKLHWGHGSRLYYGLWWTGVRICVGGGVRPIQSPQPPSCGLMDMAAVIDARTGAFVVSGTA
jgi:hypothetical protein